MALLTALLTSCGTSPTISESTAPMDFALDTGGGRLFYQGTAHIPRSFSSATSFKLEVELTAKGNLAANEPSAETARILESSYQGAGTYQPLPGGEGVISLESGRLLLRGRILSDGEELGGDWFFDGKPGGSFRITRKGTLFL